MDADALSAQLRGRHAHRARLNMVNEDVAREQDTQVAKWGVQNHANGVWFLILAEEFGEVADALLAACCGHFPAAESAILHYASTLGKQAKFVLEGAYPDQHSPGTRHDTEHELIQVAAVATAMVENRRRNRNGGIQ